MSDNTKDNVIRIIPEEERPYVWAKREMELLFPKPDRFRIHNISELVNKPNSHLSLFKRGDDEPVILRVWWNDTQSVKYDIVMNFDEMYAESPDIVEMLLRNGVYVYNELVKENPGYVTGILYGHPKLIRKGE